MVTPTAVSAAPTAGVVDVRDSSLDVLDDFMPDFVVPSPSLLQTWLSLAFDHLVTTLPVEEFGLCLCGSVPALTETIHNWLWFGPVSEVGGGRQFQVKACSSPNPGMWHRPHVQ